MNIFPAIQTAHTVWLMIVGWIGFRFYRRKRRLNRLRREFLRWYPTDRS